MSTVLVKGVMTELWSSVECSVNKHNSVDSHGDGFIHNADQVESVDVGVLRGDELLEDTQESLDLIVLRNHLGTTEDQCFP